MNDVLSNLIRTEHVVVYLNDILIFTDDMLLHRKHVKEVLERLRINNLFAKPKKCFFEKDSIKYLKMIISKNAIQMDPTKVEGVLGWLKSVKIKQVQAFLDLANFYW